MKPLNRKRPLRYYPCAGRCGESNAPEFCLCLETTCCFVNSVASTHFLLQDDRRIQNSQCDNIIIGVYIAVRISTPVFPAQPRLSCVGCYLTLRH